MTPLVVAQFFTNVITAATPLLLAALGGVFSWRAGIFHLGLEGLVLIGAFGAVAGQLLSGSVAVGVLVGIAAAVVASILFWLVIDILKADAIIAGLGLSFLGLGITSYLISAIFDQSGSIAASDGLWRPVTGATELPWSILNNLSILDWITPVLILVVWVLLRRTRWGFGVAAVGDDPFAARSAGIHVHRTRLIVLCVTGVFCALAGASLSLGALGSFAEDMAQGRGYIAFTAVVFGGGTPTGASAASLVFAFAEAIGIQAGVSSSPPPVPIELVQAIPYILTILAAWIASTHRGRRRKR